MNFFDQQDLAHRNTKRLIILLCLAVISLVAITTFLFAAVFYYYNSQQHLYLRQLGFWHGLRYSISWKMFAGISLSVCAVIFLGGLYKFFQLSGGGRTVAEAMGGQLIDHSTKDADERKILNVVEEMAIASGTPVPPVYILEDDAINAFAAGYTPQDAVIGITRGCIRLLTRDELQGVIAHEFSHIYHGDMRLNMRIVALLNGILLLGLIGEFLVRSQNYRITFRSRKDQSPFAIIAVGFGLMVIGYAGTFFGSLIKSAVSRQREFLADASAVKFTRNPGGISGALKKIGGYVSGSQLASERSAEFSHMYFSTGVSSSFLSLMDTHPPLEERIKRIEPHWNGEYPNVELNEAHHNVDTQNSYSQNSSLQNTHIKEGRLSSEPDLSKPIEFITGIDQVINTIGQPTQAHLHYAQQTLQNINETLINAAHDTNGAQALMLGLLLDKIPAQQDTQWQLLEKIFNAEELQSLKPQALEAFSLAPQLRLPLIEISLPALKQLTPTQYQRFKYAFTTLIRADQQVNLVEWSLHRILTHNLESIITSTRLVELIQLHKEAVILLSALAHAGATSETDANIAFDNSKIIIGLNDTQLLAADSYTMLDLDVAVTRLNNLKPLQKPKLIKALGQCILQDGKITTAEAELFRAIADALNCPIPPFLNLGSQDQNISVPIQ